MRNTFGNYIGRVYQIDYDFVISKQKKSPVVETHWTFLGQEEN